MRCQKCGFNDLPEGTHSCPKCGEDISKSSQTTAKFEIKQDMEHVSGGEVTGVGIDSVKGDVTIILQSQRQKTGNSWLMSLLPASFRDIFTSLDARKEVSYLRQIDEKDKLICLFACAIGPNFDRKMLNSVLPTHFSEQVWNWLLERRFIDGVTVAGNWVLQVKSRAKTYLLQQAKNQGIAQQLNDSILRYYEKQLKLGRESAIYKANYLYHLFASQVSQEIKQEKLAEIFNTSRLNYDVLGCELIYKTVDSHLSPQEQKVYKEYLQYLRGEPVDLVEFGYLLTKETADWVPLGKSSFFYYFAGRVLATYGEHLQALEMYEKAVRRTNNELEKGEIIRDIGLELTILGELSQAELYFKQAESLITYGSNSWVDLVLDWTIWYSKLGDWYEVDNLRKTLDPYLEEMPIYLRAKYFHMCGSAKLYLGDFETAETFLQNTRYESNRIGGTFDRIIGRLWRRMFAYTFEGDFQLRMGRIDLAIESLKKALNSTPNELSLPSNKAKYMAAQSRVLLAQAYRRKGQLKEAKRQLDKILSHPKAELYWEVYAWIELGRVFHKMGNPQQAQEFLKKAFELSEARRFMHWKFLAVQELLSVTGESKWQNELNKIDQKFWKGP